MKYAYAEIQALNQCGDVLRLEAYVRTLPWHELAEELTYAAWYGMDPLLNACLTRAHVGTVNTHARVWVNGRNIWTTPLIAAASCAHHCAVKKLLESGAVPSLVDDGNMCALRHACLVYCSAVVGGACVVCRAGYLATVRELVDYSVRHALDLDACDPDGENAMSESASLVGSYEVVEMLLDAGANPNRRTVGGMTPLMLAAEVGDDRVYSLLLQRGANPSLCNTRNQSARDLVRAQYRRAL